MASHFAWYPSSDSVTIPWNARYSFPTQANKTLKMTARIPPKNGSQFLPGQTIRLEFPAQGYVNPSKTTIEFDVTLSSPPATGATNNYQIRFQNNIQSIFSRVRVLYGSTPLEDIINYNVIVRNLTEWTATSAHGSMDQASIAEGIGGAVITMDGSGGTWGIQNVRQKHIQGYSQSTGAGSVNFNLAGMSLGSVPHNTPSFTGSGITLGTTRRYQVQLATGLMTCEKLIPTKFMASQLAIELTLEQPAACIFVGYTDTNTTLALFSPTYAVTEVNLIPEVLEFDASYDEMFLRGLQNGGVPIKFSSWHTFLFSSQSAATVNLQVQERSRSVKSVYCVQRRQVPTFTTDSHACFLDTSATGVSTLQNYQVRVGSRFFPASPVQVSNRVGGALTNGGAEAFVELQKALNTLGDYRLSAPVNASRWGLQNNGGTLQELDFRTSLGSILATGVPQFIGVNVIANSCHGDLGSQCFAMACSLETSNGVEISGLNAEEQSDISIIAYWALPQVTGIAAAPSALEVYTYYDAMIVLRENNVFEN